MINIPTLQSKIKQNIIIIESRCVTVHNIFVASKVAGWREKERVWGKSGFCIQVWLLVVTSLLYSLCSVAHCFWQFVVPFGL